MVYRYESGEDAFLEYPEPGSDRWMPGAGAPPPARPSPSRFPTPSLPPPARAARPVVDLTPAPIRPPVELSSAEVRATANVAPPQAPGAPERVTARATVVVPQAASYVPASGGPAFPVPAPDASLPPELPPPAAADGIRGGGRNWQALIGSAAVLVLLVLCGLVAASLVQHRTAGPRATAPTPQSGVDRSATAEGLDLGSRTTDQLALTARELFPGNAVVAVDGQPAYQVLRTQSSGSCAVAASGEIANVLARLGCNQVVRGTLRSPDGSYLLTAGLFNLTDVASAEQARDRIRPLLEQRQGRFLGMVAGDDTTTVATASARVGWQVRGHYLAYCLVTRADGRPISANDANAHEILYEIIELYLNRGVLERRSNGGVASQPTAGPADITQDGPPGN